MSSVNLPNAHVVEALHRADAERSGHRRMMCVWLGVLLAVVAFAVVCYLAVRVIR